MANNPTGPAPTMAISVVIIKKSEAKVAYFPVLLKELNPKNIKKNLYFYNSNKT